MSVTVSFKPSRTSGNNVSIGRPDVRARVIANPLSGAKEGCIDDDDRKSKARFWTSSFVLPAPIHTIGKRRRARARAESALYAPPAIDKSS